MAAQSMMPTPLREEGGQKRGSMGQRVAGRTLGLLGVVCGAVGIAVVEGISIEFPGLIFCA